MQRPALKISAKLVVHTLAAIFGSLSIIFAVAAWRLSSGPVSIAFLEPYLERAFNDENLAYRVEIDDTILTWAGWDRSLDILALNMQVLTPSGDLIASAPKVSLELSGASLLVGTVAPTSIELIGADIRLARSTEGVISFGVGDASVPGLIDDDNENREAFSALMADMLQGPREGHPLAKLHRIALLDGDLRMNDRRLGLEWRAPSADLVFAIEEEGIFGDVVLDVDLAGVGARLAATTFFDREDELLHATVRFAKVVPAELSTLSPAFAALAALDAPTNGVLEVVTDSQGRFVERVGFDINGGPGVLNAPEFVPTARLFDHFKAVGDVDPTFTLLRLDDLFVDAGGPSISFAGLVEQAASGVGISGDLTIIDMPFDEMKDYWPEELIPPTRWWVLNRVSAGVMRRFTAAIDLEPGEYPIKLGVPMRPEAVTAEFEFENITVDYLNPMPKIVGVNGTGQANTDTMFIDMWDGHVGNIKTSRGQATMWDLTGANPSGAMTVSAHASASDAAALIDSDPLRLMSEVNMRPDQISGEIDVHLGVQFPLIQAITINEIDVTAIAQLRDISADVLMVGGYPLSGGNFELSFDNEKMRVDGEAEVNGIPSKVVWRENFLDGAPFRRRYDVSAILTDSIQARLGLNLAPYTSGPLGVELVFTDNGPQDKQAAFVVDARDATLQLPELHWEKLPGESAILKMLMNVPDGGAVDILSAELRAGELRAEGSAKLAAQYAASNEISGVQFEEATLNRLLYGDNDFGATLRPDAEGGMSITVKGESLDLRPYLEDLFGQETGTLPPFVLDFDVQRLITRANQQITGARARVVNTPDRLESAYLEGALPSGKALRVVLEPNGQKRRLRVISDDAGSLARAFDIYDNAIGGELHMEVDLHDDEEPFRVSGGVDVNDYRVVNAPVLAQLLNIASLTGILESLQEDGIAFSVLRFPFEMSEDVVVIKDARASGTSLGVNADGQIDLAKNEANIHGTIVPAYAINSVLGNIPIIGEVLVGGEGEGIFAATYTVRGPLDEPVMTVNPLAALAPGFLRNLFSVFDRDAVTQEETVPPSGSDSSR
jgi:hypothetical protein